MFSEVNCWSTSANVEVLRALKFYAGTACLLSPPMFTVKCFGSC